MPRAGDLVVGKWAARFRGMIFPCAIGRGGIGDKLGEGDGITPVGEFRIMGLKYRADRLAVPNVCFTTHAIGPADVWSDDVQDPDYNHQIRNRRHPFSHENLWRADHLYDMIAILDFNWPVTTPGKGSAIFLHVWRGPQRPTEGCVAFAPDVFQHILRNWTPQARVVIRP